MPKPKKPRAKKVVATLISWDEICDEATVSSTFDEEKDCDRKFTRGNDDKLIAELRKFSGDEKTCGEWGWELMGITHLPKTTTVEWRSDRGHHAITVICWLS